MWMQLGFEEVGFELLNANVGRFMYVAYLISKIIAYD